MEALLLVLDRLQAQAMEFIKMFLSTMRQASVDLVDLQDLILHPCKLELMKLDVRQEHCLETETDLDRHLQSDMKKPSRVEFILFC